MVYATNDAPIANINEFGILAMMADKADFDGCNSFPSIPTMAKRLKIDTRTVKRCISELKARKIIVEGDQTAAAYIRADRRPVVYDVLIPYSWFPNIDRVNQERYERGREPLTPQSRPGIAPAPEKSKRADVGKPRPKKAPGKQARSTAGDAEGAQERGDSQSPRDAAEPDGVTTSPERGDLKSGTGCLEDTRTSPLPSPLTPSQAPPSSARLRAADARRATGASKGSAAGGRAAADGAAAPGYFSPKVRANAKKVLAALPRELQVLLPPRGVPSPVVDDVVDELDGRTVAQLQKRIERRWITYGYELAIANGKPINRPVGVVRALVRRGQCPDPRCEDGTDIDNGKACPRCQERREDHRRNRRKQTPEVPPGAQPDQPGARSQIPGPRGTDQAELAPEQDEQAAGATEVDGHGDGAASGELPPLYRLAKESWKSGAPLPQDDPVFADPDRLTDQMAIL